MHSLEAAGHGGTRWRRAQNSLDTLYCAGLSEHCKKRETCQKRLGKLLFRFETAMSIVTVTGANGYIASHVVAQLLSKNYIVHAAVRDPEGAGSAHLKDLPEAAERLKFFKASFDEGSYDSACSGAMCVFHMASPISLSSSDATDGQADYVDPAVGGTLSVLRSAVKAGIRSVVITSSMSAMAPVPEPDVKTEEHWSDPEGQKTRNSWYGASKTLAERAAWDFVKALPVEQSIRLATICPTMVVGPALQATVGGTMGRIKAIASGQWPAKVPNDSMSLIDVRDTAAHHVAAFELQKEGRFMSLVESWHWTELIKAFKAAKPDMPTPEPLDADAAPARPTQFDLTRMKSLGVNERPMNVIIAESVAHLVERGLL